MTVGQVVSGASADAPRRVSLAVGGMTCSSCATRVERKLNKLDGVRASVNYATGRATIAAADAVADPQLIDAVEAAGYRAEPYHGITAPRSDSERRAAKTMWLRLLVAVVLFFPLSDLALLFAFSAEARFTGWQIVLTVLAAPIVVWCAAPFHRAAWVAAKHRLGTMDTLVSLAVLVSAAWSIVTIYVQAAPVSTDGWWAALRSSGSIYLETAAGITVFVLAGRYFEAKARRSSAGALSALAALAAKDVTVLLRDGSELDIPATELKTGQRFVTKSGQRIATDAAVESGHAVIDTSAMTGETMPVEATNGDAIVGGTTVTSGRIIARATAVGADTALARMVALVERAQVEKANMQRIADRIAGVFVPIVLLLAAGTLIAWLLAGASGNHSIDAALAVLVIACPCALGLATPTALMVASGRAAQLGIFVTGHRSLEATKAVDTVVLDKTGTVTTGTITLRRAVTVDGETITEYDAVPAGTNAPEHDSVSAYDAGPATGTSGMPWLARAGAVEQAAGHVVADTIAAAARAAHGDLPEVTDFTDHPGRGVSGTVEGRDVLVGSAGLLAHQGVSIPAEPADRAKRWQATGGLAVFVAVDGHVAGLLELADTIRDTAGPAIARLRRQGLSPILLTGDHEQAARHVADTVGIDEVIAGVLPADKADVVRGLRADGRRVAFVGDGINDGPALAEADLGMAMGQGTDVAIQAADMVLVRSELTAVPDAIELSGATLGTIRWNFIWALGYNVAAIPVAMAGLANPLLASAAMALSSLFVVSNSGRLQRFRPLRPHS